METKELIEQLKCCAERNCPNCEEVESCVGPSFLMRKAAERLEELTAPASGGLISREEFMSAKVAEIEHFLNFEIMQTESWMREKYNDIFNGVLVGTSQAQELMRKHIVFCKQLLRIVNKETK